MLEEVCPQNIALKWHAEASAAVYATPLITDLFSDGRKDVVVPSFLHNLEVGARRAAGCWGLGRSWGSGAERLGTRAQLPAAQAARVARPPATPS